MNKIVKTLAIAAVAAIALTGSANAAPKCGQPQGGKPPAVQRAQPVKPVAKAPARHAEPRHEARRAPQPQPTPRHDIARHRGPEPRHGGPAMRPEPPRHHESAPRHHHNHTLHTEDWCALGATVVGGIVGGIIGAAM